MKSSRVFLVPLYPAQFEQNPAHAVDRTLRMVVGGSGKAQDYRDAIDSALQSWDEIADIIPDTHSEFAVRAYLTELRGKLSGTVFIARPPRP